MSNLISRMLDMLLGAETGVSEINIAGTLKIEKKEIAEMKRFPQTVRLMLTECFIWREALWKDFSAERVEFVRQSLSTVETELKLHEQKLSSSSNLEAIGSARFVLSWLNAVRQHGRALDKKIGQIDAEKAADPFFEYAGEARHDAMVETLKELRLKIYPTVKILLAILPDNDEVKIEAEAKLATGLRTLDPEQVIQTDPDIS